MIHLKMLIFKSIDSSMKTILNCSRMSKKDLYFKCENLQKTGSFKVRGALNTLKTILEQGNYLIYYSQNLTTLISF